MFSTNYKSSIKASTLVLLLAMSFSVSPILAKSNTVEKSNESNPSNKKSQKSETSKEADNSHLPINTSPKVSLTDLRDMGLIIQQIQQQAINIYMEATRKPVKISAKPKIEDLKFINNASIDTKTKYLKPRPEWLTFYVGTMEPIIHLFEVNARIKDKEVDYILVPRSTKSQMSKLLKLYDADVNSLNKSLSTIFDNISSENNNVVIAKAAVSLYKTAKSMEKSRVKAFKTIKKAKDKDDLVKVK